MSSPNLPKGAVVVIDPHMPSVEDERTAPTTACGRIVSVLRAFVQASRASGRRHEGAKTWRSTGPRHVQATRSNASIAPAICSRPATPPPCHEGHRLSARQGAIVGKAMSALAAGKAWCWCWFHSSKSSLHS